MEKIDKKLVLIIKGDMPDKNILDEAAKRSGCDGWRIICAPKKLDSDNDQAEADHGR